MKNSSDQKTDDLFIEVGEFGKYQLIVFVLVGITAFIPAFVSYSYSFYAAVPNHRFLFNQSFFDAFLFIYFFSRLQMQIAVCSQRFL
jgi:hypothetical protein